MERYPGSYIITESGEIIKNPNDEAMRERFSLDSDSGAGQKEEVKDVKRKASNFSKN